YRPLGLASLDATDITIAFLLDTREFPRDGVVTMRLTVGTYNVHRCIGWDGQYSRERILAVLQELQAHLIALQEVDEEDTLQWLAVHLSMTAIAGPNLRRHGAYGNGVLTTCKLGE